MSTTQDDLWPSDIKINVVSPIYLLRQNASALEERTSGILKATIRTNELRSGESVSVVHDFQIQSPALGKYVYVLFVAEHDQDLVYPVTLKFDEWDKKAERAFRESQRPTSFAEAAAMTLRARELPPPGDKSASDPDELKKYLKEIFGSSQTRAAIASLIAKANDFKPPATERS